MNFLKFLVSQMKIKIIKYLIQNCCSAINSNNCKFDCDLFLKNINDNNSSEKYEKIIKENIPKNININNRLLSYSKEKKIKLIPLKNIPDLFINYNIVEMDENGLCDNLKKSQSSKVLFNINQESNSPSNKNISTSENNKIEKKEIKQDNIVNNNDNNEMATVYINNKIEAKINKSESLFSIEYNNSLNKYILTSLVDDIFFALGVSSNKNFYLENLKRYYIQISDIIFSLLPNDIDKKIIIKELNEGEKNKYVYEIDKLPINIGRKGCNINLNNNSISKVHLIIDYDHNINQFFIRDNYSTNGSLILLKKGKDVLLEDKMFFFLVKEHFTLKRQQTNGKNEKYKYNFIYIYKKSKLCVDIIFLIIF